MNTVWVVGGTVGEWSDRHEWTLCAFTQEDDAKAFVEWLGQTIRAAKPLDDLDYDAMDQWAEDMKKYDPTFSLYCGDEPMYYCGPVEVRNSFIKPE